MSRHLVTALSVLLAVVTGGLAVASFVAGDLGLGTLWLLAAAAAAWSVVQQVRRGDPAPASAAVAEWPPERVRATVGGVDGEVARIRALRAADRRLTLADAAALVRGPRG